MPRDRLEALCAALGLMSGMDEPQLCVAVFRKDETLKGQGVSQRRRLRIPFTPKYPDYVSIVKGIREALGGKAYWSIALDKGGVNFILCGRKEELHEIYRKLGRKFRPKTTYYTPGEFRFIGTDDEDRNKAKEIYLDILKKVDPEIRSKVEPLLEEIARLHKLALRRVGWRPRKA